LSHYRIHCVTVPEVDFFSPDELLLGKALNDAQQTLLDSVHKHSENFTAKFTVPADENFLEETSFSALKFWRRILAVRNDPADEALVDVMMLDLFELRVQRYDQLCLGTSQKSGIVYAVQAQSDS
jgi:hypothetical protein